MYYSVEQVSKLLAMHPKTIQRYIREGKIPAKKVGKSWRILEQDFKAFMKDSNTNADFVKENESIPDKVISSSVVDIQVKNHEEASMIEKHLVAALNSKDHEMGRTTMHIQYLEYESKVRITLWGGLPFMQRIFEVLSIIVEQ